MKKLTFKLISLVFGLVLISATSNSQSYFNIDASQIVSNFKYLDSKGEIDTTYSPIFTSGYNLGYTYRFDFGLMLNGYLGMRKAGASMVYDASNYTWNFQYGQAKIGLGYAHDFGWIHPYVNVSGYYGYLLRAIQKINNEEFDIINSEEIGRHDIGMYFSPGAKLILSDFVAAYAQCSYLLGLWNIEAQSDDESESSSVYPKSTNTAYVFTLGLSFTIK
jgi:hypothetical protein